MKNSSNSLRSLSDLGRPSISDSTRPSRAPSILDKNSELFAEIKKKRDRKILLKIKGY